MKKPRSIYFDEQTQKVRWTQTSSDNFIYDYKYIGEATENEFNILIDLLTFLYEEDKMSHNDFMKTYKELRFFCDRIMGLVDEF